MNQTRDTIILLTIVILWACVGVMLGLTIQTHNSVESRLERVRAACEVNMAYHCIDRVRELESGGEWEVFSKDGRFFVESRIKERIQND